MALLHVKDAVLLEDGAEHGLDDDAGGGVGDEGALLVQLLGEEIHAEVAVLAGGGRGGDADDLAWAVLEHQEVTDADMVARDGDRVGDNAGRGAARGARLAALGTLNGVAVPARDVAAGVWDNLVSEFVDTLAEGMIVTWGVLARLEWDRCHGWVGSSLPSSSW